MAQGVEKEKPNQMRIYIRQQLKENFSTFQILFYTIFKVQMKGKAGGKG